MNFSATFRKKYFNNSAKLCNIVVHNSKIDNSIDFALISSESGQLLPVCRKNIESKNIDLSKGMDFLDNSVSKVNTIIGDKISVNNILKTCFGNKKVSSFNYYTMTLDKTNFTQFNQDINIRPGIQKDLENLMPLQKNYEIEEVLPYFEIYNKTASKAYLSMALENQITVVAEKNGKIIAKANTNEKGFVYYQIGGVYTLPEYRNTGVSTAIVSYLLENIFLNGMKASLFVKIKNSAAIKVYEKLGFNKIEEFQITYFIRQ
jgi:ribosomal protein S18 acetylase RimI-like enzyme